MTDFIIVGNTNAVTYKEVFPLIKDNKMWLGYKPLSGEMYFHITEKYKKEIIKTKKEGTGWVEIDGEVMARVTQACWFTNLPVSRNLLILTKTYNPEKYPKYDNYDAIEVSRVENIPCDYDGVMGVPITYLDKHNPNQFEILGYEHNLDGNGANIAQFEINGKGVYKRILIHKVQFEIVGMANNVRYIGDYPCLTVIEGKPIYNRILIRKKKEEEL